MKRQRYIYTIPTQDATSATNETDAANNLSAHYLFQDPLWPQIIPSEPEPIIPYCLYQYPFYPPSENFSSSSNIYSDTFPFNNFGNFNILEGIPSEPFQFVNECHTCDPIYGDEYFRPDESQETVAFDNVEASADSIPNGYPVVTNYGAVTILLRHLVRIDISPDQALYVTNLPASCVAVVNGNADKSCIIHPNGRVLQDNDDVHMATLTRKAKMCKRGIIFTSSGHCLSYLVDASGTKTTAEKFQDLSKDFSLGVFYSDLMIDESMQDCYKMVSAATHKTYKNGDVVWMVGAYRIKQDHCGDVKITHMFSRRTLKASPTNGQMSIKTRMIEMKVGRYPHNYFVVKKGNKFVSASLKGFNVQNGTQKAGFNNSGKVILI